MAIDINQFRGLIESQDLAKVQDLMYRETAAGYHVYNPFVCPVAPRPGMLLANKMSDLKYTSEMFTNKTVADLGCALGFFTFFPLCLGAKSSVGYDLREDYVIANNIMAENYVKLYPQFAERIKFTQVDLSLLPEIGPMDVLVVHSLIHWFIMFKRTPVSQIVDWLANSCTEAIYFEGCVDASEEVMQQHHVPLDFINLELFVTELKKRFGHVEVVGSMSYNPKRYAIQAWK